jgi:Response regulator containing CheY-like receiver, AAA-type ATPase, and DNA-binding domains
MLEKIPVLLVSADNSIEFERKGYQKGAFDFIHKPFDGTVVKARLKRAVDLYESKNHLEQIVEDQTDTLEKQVKQLKKQEKIQKQTNTNIVDVMRQKLISSTTGVMKQPDQLMKVWRVSQMQWQKS